jgi:hypothetical protein
MATPAWDVNGEARLALYAVVQEHGLAALSSRQVLADLLEDLLPDSPPESSVLIAAAEADAAGLLRDRLGQQVGAGAAVAQAAGLLEERTGLAPDACQWAVRLIAEMIDLPVDVGPVPGETAPQPETRPWPQAPPQTQPRNHLSPSANAGPAAVAAWVALGCALSVPLQLLARGGLPMPYGWETALFGLILFGAALLTLRGASRHLGVGLIFGAALGVVPAFVEQSFVSGLGGGYVAASVITTVTALGAAISAIVYFAPEIRWSNLRAPLAVPYSLAALGLVVAFNPGDVQYRSGQSWVTLPGFVGPGADGWFLFAGIVSIVALVVPAVIAGLLPRGTGVRAGLIIGWLAINGAGLVSESLWAIQPYLRPAPALYIAWGVWVLTLLLAVALLAGSSRPAVSAQSTLVS